MIRAIPPIFAIPSKEFPSNLTNGSVFTVVESDDSLYVAGNFSVVYPEIAPKILKLDTSNANSKTIPGLLNGFDNTVRIFLKDGNNLYIAGSFTTYNGLTCPRIAKLNLTTGALDATFNVGTGPSDEIYTLVKDGDDLYIGGNFQQYNGTTRQRIAKISAITGALDATFDSASGCASYVNCIVKDGNDLYISGNFNSYKGISRQKIAKIDATTAALDIIFSTITGANAAVTSFVKDGNNLYLTGNFTSFKGITRQYVAKISATTALLDLLFDSASGCSSYNNVIIKDENSLYIGGQLTTYKGTARQYIVKIDATTAALDATFDSSTGFSSYVNTILKDGNDLYVGGNFLTYKGNNRQYATKIDATTAALDTTFNTSIGFSSGVYAFLKDNTDLYVGGGFKFYKGTVRQQIAKFYKTDWRLDTVFDTENGFNSYIYTIVKVADSLYVGGNFTTYKGITRQYIAKINALSGALDAGFDTSSGFSGVVNRMILSGTDLYVGGNFATYKGTARQCLAKISTLDASLDVTFDTASGFNQYTYTLVKDGNDLYVGGNFTAYKGTARQYIAKLNATTATLDATFDATSGFNNVVFVLLKDGSDIYVGGNFTTYKGTTRQSLCKLNSVTAAIDAIFDTSTGYNANANSLVSYDGKIFVGGNFTQYKGATCQRLNRINKTDASLDMTFDTTLASNSNVYWIHSSDNLLYILGSFSSYKGKIYSSGTRINKTVGLLT